MTMDWATFGSSLAASGIVGGIVSWRIAGRESKDRDKALAEQQRQFDAQHALEREKWQAERKRAQDELKRQRQDRLSSLYRDTTVCFQDAEQAVLLMTLDKKVSKHTQVLLKDVVTRLDNLRTDWHVQGADAAVRAVDEVNEAVTPFYIADSLTEEIRNEDPAFDIFAPGKEDEVMTVVFKAQRALDAAYRAS